MQPHLGLAVPGLACSGAELHLLHEELPQRLAMWRQAVELRTDARHAVPGMLVHLVARRRDQATSAWSRRYGFYVVRPDDVQCGDGRWMRRDIVVDGVGVFLIFAEGVFIRVKLGGVLVVFVFFFCAGFIRRAVIG